MTRPPHSNSAEGNRWRPWVLVLLTLVAVATPGCGGCRPETPQERAAREQREIEEAEARRKELEEKKKTPPLEISAPAPQPNRTDSPLALVKPGHWMAATQAMKANEDDWVGEATLQIVDRKNQPLPLDRTAFALRSERDVALAKGELKQVESTFYVPAAESKLSSRTTLRERGASLAAPPSSLFVQQMKAHQHHLVVLATEPRRYDFIAAMRSVKAPFKSDYEAAISDAIPHERQYIVVAPTIDQEIPLPENPLCWTTIAYILWDEIDPERLSAAQRTALVDWIHWGGELIISGPDSLDLLQGSFLAPYLPADSEGARTITADDLQGISQTWGRGRDATPIAPVGEWSGLKLKLRSEAQPLAGAGDLFAERLVGRGRIIVSAMQLAERDLVNWADGFENLFNSLLLRRPPREFAINDTSFLGDGSEMDSLYVIRDPRKISAAENSKVRFFARDVHSESDAFDYRIATTEDEFGGAFETIKLADPPVRGGVASWNDFSAVATAARGVLREAAGVNVPGSEFVIGCIAVYLTVLVPFNWFVFRALGRIELAWLAAPVIAILGTWAVVRQAQLDIGFVRAQTEVAILETQPNHTRACLTRYVSFYTSLSTTYDLEFADPTTLAAPFARGDESPLLRGQSPSLVTYERQEIARLNGLTVSSNSTDMAHTEQIFDLGGALRYDDGRNQLINETDHDFVALAVVRRPAGEAERLQGCWIGSLGGRSSTNVSFSPLSSSEEEAVFAAERAEESTSEERLDFESLFRVALDPRHMEPGEVRAVAYLDKVMPGVEVAPRASQLRGGTLLVAHLKYGRLPAPQMDKNSPQMVLPRR